MLQYPWRLVGLVFAVALAVALLGAVQQRMCRDAGPSPKAAIWQARYAEKAIEAERVADTVVRTVERVRVRRDTVLAHVTDTLLVKSFVYQTDTLRIACEKCAATLRSFRLTSDSTIRHWQMTAERNKPNLLQRSWPLVFVVGVAIGAKATR